MIRIRALVADTEVQLLHTFNFVADILQLADAAVGGQTLHDVGQGVGDSIDFLGVFEHGLEVHGGVSHKDDGDIQNVDILLVCLDVAIASKLMPFFIAFLLTRTCSRWLSGDILTM